MSGTLHRLASQCADIAKDPDQAERELIAVWGPGFRQVLEIEAKHHQLLLRLAGYAIPAGVTLEQIKHELFQARDARLAERKKEPGSNPRVTSVNWNDLTVVLKNLSAGGLGYSVKGETGVVCATELAPRSVSVTPRVTSTRRKAASSKLQDGDEPGMSCLLPGPRELILSTRNVRIGTPKPSTGQPSPVHRKRARVTLVLLP